MGEARLRMVIVLRDLSCEGGTSWSVPSERMNLACEKGDLASTLLA